MSRKKVKEENPFSFTNFAPQKEESLPFPDDTPKTKVKTKRKKKAVLFVEDVEDVDDGFDIVGGKNTKKTVKKEEENPYSFKTFDPNISPVTTTHATVKDVASSNLSPLPVTTGDMSSGSSISDSDEESQIKSVPHNITNTNNDEDDDDDLSFDDDDDDNMAALPTPQKPKVAKIPIVVPVPDESSSDASGGGGGGTVAGRIKRRMDLLKQQLDAAKKELSMTQEQYDLDIAELQEDNTSLRTALKAAQATAEEAKKKAASAIAALDRRKKTEKQEAAVLEDFTERMQQNFEQATQRAGNAEAQVARLSAEVNNLRQSQISGGALTQVKYASNHLKTLAASSEKSLRQLCEGVKTLQLASEILNNVGKIDEQPDP